MHATYCDTVTRKSNTRQSPDARQLRVWERSDCNILQRTATHFKTLQHSPTNSHPKIHTMRQSQDARWLRISIRRTTLQHTAVWRTALQNNTLFVITLQHNATRCRILQHTAARWNEQTLENRTRENLSCATTTIVRTLLTYRSAKQQHTAARVNTLQHNATHCNTLQHTVTWKRDTGQIQDTRQLRSWESADALHCNTLQHTATTHCNTLQHTITHSHSKTQHETISRCATITNVRKCWLAQSTPRYTPKYVLSKAATTHPSHHRTKRVSHQHQVFRQCHAHHLSVYSKRT